MTEPGVASPCVKVCTLDASGTLCTGCFRTLEEIGLWPGLSNDERRRIIAELRARRARYASGTNDPGD